MQIIYSDGPKKGQEDLLSLLTLSLKEGQVLWLLSGGSNTEIEAEVINEIDEGLTKNLKLLLVDERFGPSGHTNSNYQHLKTNGFDPKNARFIDILENSSSAKQSLNIFIQEYEKLRASVNTIIGQLGIGSDGHIAGVLAASDGVTAPETAIYYQGGDYLRISLTLRSLKNFNHTYVFCFGEDKKEPLEHLKNADVSLELCPSLILREMTDVKVYNDRIKEG